MNLGLANAASATALAILVAATGKLLSRRPAVLHCLWLLVLVKLVTPPLWHVPLAAWEPCIMESASEVADGPFLVETVDEPDGAAFVTTIDPETPIPGADPGAVSWRAFLLPALGGLWICGAFATLVVTGVRVGRFHRLLGHAYPASAEVQDEVDV